MGKMKKKDLRRRRARPAVRPDDDRGPDHGAGPEGRREPPVPVRHRLHRRRGRVEQAGAVHGQHRRGHPHAPDDAVDRKSVV